MSRLTISRGIGVIGKIFFVLLVSTLCFFFMLGIFGMAQSKLATSPVSSMKGIAAAVSTPFFTDLIAMEIPHFNNGKGDFTFSQRHIASFLFQFMTDINPSNPKSLLARVLPGMGNDDATLLRQGTGTNFSESPADYVPSNDRLKPDPNLNKQSGTDAPSDSTSNITGTGATAKPGTNADEVSPAPSAPNQAEATPAPASDNKGTGTDAIAQGSKVVFIYHSHNRESWVPELKAKGVKKISEAFDSKINITLLGQRLAKQLNDLGIGAFDSNVDYPSVVPNFNWNFSYKYSSLTVKDAFASHHELLYYFDIHRDSQVRDLTTVKINNLNYAQLYFIIGHKNPNWEKNEQFAKKIHDKIDKLYPGLSRGIWTKTASSGNAEYNQSFSPNSILIEVGGPENTLQESYRTIDILSKVIADIYWEAEKVNAPGKSSQKAPQS